MKPARQESGSSSLRALSRFLVPLGIIAFCAWAFWLTTQFDRVPPILKRGMQPSDFPQLIIGLMVFLALALMVWDKETPPDPAKLIVWKSIALLVGFVAIAEIDLILAIGVFAGCLSVVWGERRIALIAVVTIVVPLAVFLMFDTVFEVRFPRGLLTQYWYG